MFGDTMVFSALLAALFGLAGVLHRFLSPVDTVIGRVQPVRVSQQTERPAKALVSAAV